MDMIKVKVKVNQLCLTFCESVDYTVRGIPQTRILECVAFPFSRGSSQPMDQTQVSCIFYQLSHKGNPRILEWVVYLSLEDLPDPEIKSGSPALQADYLPTDLSGKPMDVNWIIKKAETKEVIFSNCGT